MNKRMIVVGAIVLLVCLILVGVVDQAKKAGRAKSKAMPLYKEALSLQSKGELDRASELYRQLVNDFPQDRQAAQALYNLGEIYAGERVWEKSQESYAKLIADFPNFEQISDVEKKLWQANLNSLFSPVVTGQDIAYKVEPGDTLGAIARRHDTTVDLIMRSNNLKGSLIRPGQRLKISAAKYSVVVDKSQNTLTLKADDSTFKVYPVATGKYDCTPTGTFTIVEKLKNPDWYKGGKGIIPADSPENILGTRWLGLSEPQYGIHGGAAEQDLGTQVTDGCVRMLNADAEELFTILPRGTEVIVVD